MSQRSVGIRQYVYFALWSSSVSAAEIEAQLRLEPDEILVRGERQADPPVPVEHKWAIASRESLLRIGDQARSVLERVRPVEEKIRELVLSGACTATLQIVRIYEPAPELDGRLIANPELLGFHLTPDDVAFLARVCAAIDQDEVE